MDKWARLVDSLLTEVIGDGDVSQLTPAGKPLALADDAHTPEDQRVSAKIMRDHNVMPDWIAEGKALETAEADFRAELTAQALRFHRDMQALPSARRQAAIERRWANFLAEFRQRAQAHNRKLLSFNLSLPKGIPHKPLPNVDELIAAAMAAAEKSQ